MDDYLLAKALNTIDLFLLRIEWNEALGRFIVV
jgi:hypothetical protein